MVLSLLAFESTHWCQEELEKPTGGALGGPSWLGSRLVHCGEASRERSARVSRSRRRKASQDSEGILFSVPKGEDRRPNDRRGRSAQKAADSAACRAIRRGRSEGGDHAKVGSIHVAVTINYNREQSSTCNLYC